MYAYYGLCNKSNRMLAEFKKGVIPLDKDGKFKSSLCIRVEDFRSNRFIYSQNIQDLIYLKQQIIYYIEQNKNAYNNAQNGLADKLLRTVKEFKLCMPCIEYVIPVDEQGNPL